MTDVAVEAGLAPVDRVIVAVGQSSTHAGESHTVRVGTGVGQERLAVATDEDGETILGRPAHTRAFQAVVGPVVIDGLTVEEATKQLHRFGQPLLADPPRPTLDPRGRELGRGVARAQTEFETPTRDPIDRDGLPCQLHGVAHLVVEHIGAEPDPVGDGGDGGQRRQWRHRPTDVIGHEDDVEPELLGPTRRGNGIGSGGARDLMTEAGSGHAPTLRPGGDALLRPGDAVVVEPEPGLADGVELGPQVEILVEIRRRGTDLVGDLHQPIEVEVVALHGVEPEQEAGPPPPGSR